MAWIPNVGQRLARGAPPQPRKEQSQQAQQDAATPAPQPKREAQQQ